MAEITYRVSRIAPEGYGRWDVTLPGFDPALGQLTGVTYGATGTVTADIRIENLDQAPVAVGVAIAAQVVLEMFQELVNSGSAAMVTAQLAARDDIADFAGPAGLTSLGTTGTNTVTRYEAANGGFANGIGTVLRVAPNMSVIGGGSMNLLTGITSVVAEASVTYHYDEAEPPVPPLAAVPAAQDAGPAPAGAPSGAAAVFTRTEVAGQYYRATAQAGHTVAFEPNPFIPDLGTLVSVNLHLTTGMRASATVEQRRSGFGTALVKQSVAGTVTLAGHDAPLAAATASVGRWFPSSDGAFDTNLADETLPEVQRFAGTDAVVTDPAILAEVTGLTRRVVMDVATRGETVVQGLTDMLAEVRTAAYAWMRVSYSYVPSYDFVPLVVANRVFGDGFSTMSEGVAVVPDAYDGPVAGIAHAHDGSADTAGLAVTLGADGFYIRTGAGDDAIAAHGGTNVIDGGGGSNFLVGGLGADTFFIDATAGEAPRWNTLDQFGPGDSVTLWGLTEADFLLDWRDGQGAGGHAGLTLHARMGDGPVVSTTLSGWTRDDLDSGRLAAMYGVAGETPYLYVHAV